MIDPAKQQEFKSTKQVVFDMLDSLKYEPELLREYIGTLLCDGGCPRYNDACPNGCYVHRDLEDYISSIDTDARHKKLATLKASVGSVLHNIVFKGGD